MEEVGEPAARPTSSAPAPARLLPVASRLRGGSAQPLTSVHAWTQSL